MSKLAPNPTMTSTIPDAQTVRKAYDAKVLDKQEFALRNERGELDKIYKLTAWTRATDAASKGHFSSEIQASLLDSVKLALIRTNNSVSYVRRGTEVYCLLYFGANAGTIAPFLLPLYYKARDFVLDKMFEAFKSYARRVSQEYHVNGTLFEFWSGDIRELSDKDRKGAMDKFRSLGYEVHYIGPRLNITIPVVRSKRKVDDEDSDDGFIVDDDEELDEISSDETPDDLPIAVRRKRR